MKLGFLYAGQGSQHPGMGADLYEAHPAFRAVLDAADNAGRYLELMRVDKKAEAGAIRFVLIDGPGQAVVRAAPDALVREVIGACCSAPG